MDQGQQPYVAPSISAVCLLTRNDCEIFEFLLSSLNLHTKGYVFEEFIIVCPGKDVDYIKDMFDNQQHHPDNHLRFVTDEEILPTTENSWFKQQVLKIWVSKYVKSDFYIIFDADIICVNDLTYESLIINGKACTEILLTSNDDSTQNTAWYLNSARFLSYDPHNNHSVANPQAMNVTPNIFSRHVAVTLIQYLTFIKVPPTELVVLLRQRNITEFGLYWAWAQKTGLVNQYHTSGKLHHKHSVWYWYQAMAFHPDLIKEDTAPFLIFQSNTKVPPCITRNLLIAHIEDPKNCYMPRFAYVPLVSCLMVTKNRLRFAKSAISHFQKQIYPHKELVIVSHGQNELVGYVRSLNDNRIRIHHIDTEDLILGDLRNMSIELATGEYCIQWDDDDFYHPTRISVMLEHLFKNDLEATFLSQWTMAWPSKGYYSISKNYPFGWENTMLIKKDKMPRYPSLRRGEDTAFCDKLKKQGVKCGVINEPGYHILYLYVVHGANTWNDSHFMDLFTGTKLIHEHDKFADGARVRQAICDLANHQACNGIERAVTVPQGSSINYWYIVVGILIFIIFCVVLYMIIRSNRMGRD